MYDSLPFWPIFTILSHCCLFFRTTGSFSRVFQILNFQNRTIIKRDISENVKHGQIHTLTKERGAVMCGNLLIIQFNCPIRTISDKGPFINYDLEGYVVWYKNCPFPAISEYPLRSANPRWPEMFYHTFILFAGHKRGRSNFFIFIRQEGGLKFYFSDMLPKFPNPPCPLPKVQQDHHSGQEGRNKVQQGHDSGQEPQQGPGGPQ